MTRSRLLGVAYTDRFRERYGGDRLIFRVEAGVLFVVDIVSHDDIGRYGTRPRPRRS